MCDAAEGEHGKNGRLLKCGATLPVSEYWPWGEFACFSFLNVSVDSRALVGTAQEPGEDCREEVSWPKDDCNAVMICKIEKKSFFVLYHH